MAIGQTGRPVVERVEVAASSAPGAPVNVEVRFLCPGCGLYHSLPVEGSKTGSGAGWHWNGDPIRPTLQPSIFYPSKPRCHSFVRDGSIQFLCDSDHPLAGKTVPLNPVES